MTDMNSGYHGYSMSKRAYKAYQGGEKPMSKWTKRAMLEEIAQACDEEDLKQSPAIAKMKKAEIFGQFFTYSSWHHTSRFCNATDFYELDLDALREVCRPLTADEIAERDAKERQRIAAEQDEYYRMKTLREVREQAEREYKEAHGFEPTTFAALAATYPERITRRQSKKHKANTVLVYQDGEHTVECIERETTRKTVLWFNAAMI